MLAHLHRLPGAPLMLTLLLDPAMQEVMHLTAAVAKEYPALEGARALGGAIPPLLGRGMLRAAVCAACNHKDLAAAALQCLAAVVGEAGASRHAQLPC